MHAPPVSQAVLQRAVAAGAPPAVRVRVRVSDPAYATGLRDYLRRLGVCALTRNGGTVEAECVPGSDLQPTREELDGYIDGWVKANRIPVQLT